MRSQPAFLAAFAATVVAQTPPGYEPGTSALLPASFGSLEITPGLPIAKNATQSAPTLTPPSTSYVALMIDLDAPTPQNDSFSPIIHWITASSNSSVVPYGAPAPPAGSPEHRYVVLSYDLPVNVTGAFMMPKGFETVGTGDVTTRVLFDVGGFVEAAGLGELKAANYFTVSPEGNGTTTAPQPPTDAFPGAATRMAGFGGMVGLVGLAAAIVVMVL